MRIINNPFSCVYKKTYRNIGIDINIEILVLVFRGTGSKQKLLVSLIPATYVRLCFYLFLFHPFIAASREARPPSPQPPPTAPR